MQGFYTAVDRESLRFWRVTPGDLAELAAGGPLDPPPSAARSRSQAVLEADIGAQEHVATSNEPVVNTLWKVRSNWVCQSARVSCMLDQLRLRCCPPPAAWRASPEPGTSWAVSIAEWCRARMHRRRPDRMSTSGRRRRAAAATAASCTLPQGQSWCDNSTAGFVRCYLKRHETRLERETPQDCLNLSLRECRLQLYSTRPPQEDSKEYATQWASCRADFHAVIHTGMSCAAGTSAGLHEQQA